MILEPTLQIKGINLNVRKDLAVNKKVYQVCKRIIKELHGILRFLKRSADLVGAPK